MPTLTSTKRNFCYNCKETLKGIVILRCPKCGNQDLIPTPLSPPIEVEIPEDYFQETKTKIFDPKEIDALYEELKDIEQPKKEDLPKIELDQLIVDLILRTQFMFITGLAGTGKSTLIREIARRNPNFLELTSTTGIAAINLGGKTINSTLKYFDTKSLEKLWTSGYLHHNLRAVRDRSQVLGIEEVSMMDGTALNYIVDAVDEINNDIFTDKKLGIHLIGDLAQLPPIKAPFCFMSKFWQRFEDNTLKLDKIWRQENPDFIKAINLVRNARGNDAVVALMDCGVKFTQQLDDNFDGTTIIPKNDEVDNYNAKRLAQLQTPTIRISPTRRGKQLGEWEKNIPYELRLKVGAYVMILNNDSPNFTYVNGDTGEIVSFDSQTEVFQIKLKRNGDIVKIGNIVRQNYSDVEPEAAHFSSMFTPYVDQLTKQWVLGTIRYVPLRLAYASTVHKSQGLSLDKVQVDSRHMFFGSPNMAYVAISRCRTPDGLTIIGNPTYVAGKIRNAPEEEMDINAKQEMHFVNWSNLGDMNTIVGTWMYLIQLLLMLLGLIFLVLIFGELAAYFIQHYV